MNNAPYKQISFFVSITCIALTFLIIVNRSLFHWMEPSVFSYDEKRILQLIIFGITSLLLIVNRNERIQWLETYQSLSHKTRIIFTVFLILACISAIFAITKHYAFLGVGFYYQLFVLTIFVATKYRIYQKKFENHLLFWLFLSIAIYAIIFFVHILPHLNQSDFLTIAYANAPDFTQVRFFSHFLTWTLPLTPLPIFLVHKKIFKGLALLAGSAWWALVFFTISRGTMLSILVTSIAAVLIFRTQVKQWLITQIILIIIGIVIFYFCVISHSLLLSDIDHNTFVSLVTTPLQQKISDTQSFLQRIILWKDASHLILQHPFFGIGLFNYSYFYSPIAAHPHNSILLLASELGIPAAILILIIFVGGLTHWIRFCKKQTQNLNDNSFNNIRLIALTISLIAASIHSLGCGIIVSPVSQIMACLIIGWMLGIYLQQKQTTPSQLIFCTSSLKVLLGSILISIALICLGIFPQVLQLKEKEFAYFVKHATCSQIDSKHYDCHVNASPYFWSQGFIKTSN